MSDTLPAITIDAFTVVRPRPTVRHPQGRQPRNRDLPLAALRHRYATTVGAYRGLSPRFESRVEQRLDRSVDDVLRTMDLEFTYDPVALEFRAPATLHVKWSWPRLKIWFAVTDASRGRAAISVRLRSRRRLRYPRRYYAAAHELLRATRSGSRSQTDPAPA